MFNSKSHPSGRAAKRASFYANLKAYNAELPSELVIYRISFREKQAEMPAGFWAQERDVRHTLLLLSYPNIAWAGNGQAGGGAINHYFD